MLEPDEHVVVLEDPRKPSLPIRCVPIGIEVVHIAFPIGARCYWIRGYTETESAA